MTFPHSHRERELSFKVQPGHRVPCLPPHPPCLYLEPPWNKSKRGLDQESRGERGDLHKMTSSEMFQQTFKHLFVSVCTASCEALRNRMNRGQHRNTGLQEPQLHFECYYHGAQGCSVSCCLWSTPLVVRSPDPDPEPEPISEILFCLFSDRGK